MNSFTYGICASKSTTEELSKPKLGIYLLEALPALYNSATDTSRTYSII